MKKVLQVLGFALVAMVLFAGCGKKDKWKDVDKDVTEITFSDGKWEGVAYSSATMGGVSMEYEYTIEFTVANNKCTATGGEMYVSAGGQSSTDEMPAMYINMLKDVPTAAFISTLSGMVAGEGGSFPAVTEFKTNEDKTKYRYYKETDGSENEVYFVKQ